MALEARNVFFRYGKKGPYVLEDVSLRLEAGERVALLGGSGRGESTLARLLSGYDAPEKGEILLDGAPLPREGVCPVQLVFQHPEQAVDPRWKLKRVLEEGGAAAPEVLEALGIERAWLERYAHELSGGELQRFCLARALGSGPKYLICDEISTMLDAIAQAQIWRAVLAAAEKSGAGVLAVTHDRALAARIAQRVVEL